MKKVAIFFCFLFFAFHLFAQSQKTNFPFFNNLKGERKVFADTAILRVAPSTGAAITDTIFAGNDINILMQVPYSEVRNNVSSPWLKVTYKKNSFTKVAFISAIDISINQKLTAKDIDIVFGVIKNDRKDSIVNNEIIVTNNYKCKLISFKKGKNIDAVVFDIPKNFSVDSIATSFIEKTKLNKTVAAIRLLLSSKNDNEGDYKFNFVLCNSIKIVQLPTQHNYLVKLSKNWVNEDLLFHYQSKDFAVISRETNTPFGGKTFYKWKDCSYKEL